jgi:hypothetical protein
MRSEASSKDWCSVRHAERRPWIRRIGVILGIAILASGCDSTENPNQPAADRSSSVASERDSSSPSLESLSDGGHYRIRARPAASPIELHRLHDWIVGIELTEASSEIPTAIHFDGGMPAHGHGFVTQPRVTQNLGHGEFLVEGVKFHMPGEWALQITVKGATTSDQVTLLLTIEP